MFSVRRTSLGTDDAGQLPAGGVRRTRQSATLHLDGVDQPGRRSLSSAGRHHRCLVHAYVAVPSVRTHGSGERGHQVPGVLGGPAGRTLCSSWHHGNRGPALYVAQRTGRRLSEQRMAVVVALGEHVITASSRTGQYVFYASNLGGPALVVVDVAFPLRNVR